MKTVKLDILANDIRNSRYTDPGNCAITRALRRAGISAEENGFSIKEGDRKLADTPPELLKKVMSMYGITSYYANTTAKSEAITATEPEDFSFEIELDI